MEAKIIWIYVLEILYYSIEVENNIGADHTADVTANGRLQKNNILSHIASHFVFTTDIVQLDLFCRD